MRSSSKTTSQFQWRRFSPPVPLDPGHDDIGLNIGHWRGADKIYRLNGHPPATAILLVLLRPLVVRVRQTWITWPAAEKSTHLGTSTALTVVEPAALVWVRTVLVTWSRAERRRGAGFSLCEPHTWSYRPQRPLCGPRWCCCACRTMKPGGRRGLQCPPPGAPTGSSTPRGGFAPLVGPERRSVGDVLPYRYHRQAATADERSRDGQGQDGGQAVAHPAPIPGRSHS